MNMHSIKDIANSILYEGYLLYPYRRSALKNRQRWTYGVVYPHAYSAAQGNIEPWYMHTECLLIGNPSTTIDVTIRFLHLIKCTTTQANTPSLPAHAYDSPSDFLSGESWEEGMEREIQASNLSIAQLLAEPTLLSFDFSGTQLPADHNHQHEKREIQSISGTIHISITQAKVDTFKLTIRIENTTPNTENNTNHYTDILLHSLVSTHTIMHTNQGQFISQQDPPNELKSIAASCRCERSWPVLIGDTQQQNTILSSPIILYDYPQIAPESPGSLFDGTEIDEILSLRIMTLTDEEKQAIKAGDERAREVLERTESLTEEQWLKLHGTLREPQTNTPVSFNYRAHPGEDSLPPKTIEIAGKVVQAGDPVRLWPSKRADAFDFLLTGKTARVEIIEQDFENRVYLVVTLDDDPGREQWDERVLPGHRFFFFPEEIEPLEAL